MKNKVTPFLWFDKDMDGVLKYYEAVFKDFEILKRTEVSDTPSGTVEVAGIQFLGGTYTFMTAGPLFKFNESVSFVINCENQEEVDYYWNYFTKDGKESDCGWCKDMYGVSWQITPNKLLELINSPDKEIANFATQQMMTMQKIIIQDLEK